MGFRKHTFFIFHLLLITVWACKPELDPPSDALQDLRTYIGNDTTKALYLLHPDSSKIYWNAGYAVGQTVSGWAMCSEGLLITEDGIITGGYFALQGDSGIWIAEKANQNRLIDWNTIKNTLPTLANPKLRHLRFDIISASSYITRSDFLIPPGNQAPLEPTHTLSGNLTVADSTRLINVFVRVEKQHHNIYIKGRYTFPYQEWGILPLFNSDSANLAPSPVIDCDFRLCYRRHNSRD